MILNNGAGENDRVLREETVALLSTNQMGALTVPSVKTANPMLSNDMPLPPDIPHQWGLATMINTKALPTGRAAGRLRWAGRANSYYCDRKRVVWGNRGSIRVNIGGRLKHKKKIT